MRRFWLSLVLVLILSVPVFAWNVTPVTPLTGFIPEGTVLKKLSGSDTFIFDEVGSGGASLVQNDPNSGPIDVATPAFQIGATKTDIGGYVPANAVGVHLAVFNGDLIIGYTGDIATGAVYTGIRVASGSWVEWKGIVPGTFHCYGLANQAGSVDCRLTAW